MLKVFSSFNQYQFQLQEEQQLKQQYYASNHNQTSQKNSCFQQQFNNLDHRRNSIESLQSTQINSGGGSANSSQFVDDQEGGAEHEIFDNYHNPIQQTLAQEIDVMPKRKVFSNVQERLQFVAEYKKKIKTELCKNWILKGTCKFGDKCSFAHGRNELKEKSHLHTYYKTKPCKQFFRTGYCPYGYRCQYLHSDINNHQEFRKFLSKLQQAKKLCVMQHNLQQKNGYQAKFNSLQKSKFQGDSIINVAEMLGAFGINKNNQRMRIFKEISGQQVIIKAFDEKDLIFNDTEYS